MKIVFCSPIFWDFPYMKIRIMLVKKIKNYTRENKKVPEQNTRLVLSPQNFINSMRFMDVWCRFRFLGAGYVLEGGFGFQKSVSAFNILVGINIQFHQKKILPTIFTVRSPHFVECYVEIDHTFFPTTATQFPFFQF